MILILTVWNFELQPTKETLIVVGGGAAGIYGAIRAKTVAPDLNVVVIEKGKPLSKVLFLRFLFTEVYFVVVV